MANWHQSKGEILIFKIDNHIINFNNVAHIEFKSEKNADDTLREFSVFTFTNGTKLAVGRSYDQIAQVLPMYQEL